MSDETRGLYWKYRVERMDGSSAPGGKHHGCPVYVLDIRHDPHARKALAAYIESCEADFPLLAADLRNLLADES
jgi:folylpolyglutamate synthase/dihydropteroate synthase